MMKQYTDEGIVLARRDYGEADRILIIFTKEHGKISIIAKGVRKAKSRKRGSLEQFNRMKFVASVGKSLDIVTEASVLEDFDKIRDSLKKVSVAYYFCEIVGRTTREGERHDEIYRLLLGNLRKLEETDGMRSLRENFARELLYALGFWPKGKKLDEPDRLLEELVERKLATVRVGKKLMR